MMSSLMVSVGTEGLWAVQQMDVGVIGVAELSGNHIR